MIGSFRCSAGAMLTLRAGSRSGVHPAAAADTPLPAALCLPKSSFVLSQLMLRLQRRYTAGDDGRSCLAPRHAPWLGAISAPPAAPHQNGPPVLGRARTGLAPVAGGARDRQTRHRFAWQRQAFRRFWTWKSRRRVGRPAVPLDVRQLIRTMSVANPLWGAPRLHGELLKLGIAVSQATVAKDMIRRRQPPSQTWRTFLRNHIEPTLWFAADFVVVPTVTGRLLFVLILLAHDRRRIVHVGVTAHPTAEWTAQRVRDAFPWDTAPRFLLHDHDTAFAGLSSLDLQDVRTAPRSPWQNTYVERFIGSLRTRVPRSRRRLERGRLASCAERLHQYTRRRGGHIWRSRRTRPFRDASPPCTAGRVIAVPQVGGLHHRYERRAA